MIGLRSAMPARVRIALAAWALVAATFATVGAAAPALAGDCPAGDPRYGAPIEIPNFGGTNGRGVALNNRNPPVVVAQGYDEDSNDHGLRWVQGGQPRDLGTVVVTDINDKNVVVGRTFDGSGNTDAAMWSAAGTEIDLPRLSVGSITSYQGLAWSINEAGQIAGLEYGKDPSTTSVSIHAVRWDDASTVVDLHQTGQGWANDSAVAINETAQIAGQWRSANVTNPHSHGVRWTGGDAADLPGPDIETVTFAINDAGKVVGRHNVEGGGSGWVPVVWTPGGSDPIELVNPGFDFVTTTSINDSDHITGYVGTQIGPAVVWLSNGHGAWTFNDLNCLIPKDTGWTLIAANDINERGDIVGTGIDPEGHQRGFLLRIAATELLDLSVSNAVGREGSTALAGRDTPPTGKVVFTIRRSGGGVVSSVHYATVAGTAKPGVDYTAVEGTLSFTRTQKVKTVTVLLKRDHRDEPNETFTLKLSRPVRAHIEDGTGLGTIRDDD